MTGLRESFFGNLVQPSNREWANHSQDLWILTYGFEPAAQAPHPPNKRTEEK